MALVPFALACVHNPFQTIGSTFSSSSLRSQFGNTEQSWTWAGIHITHQEHKRQHRSRSHPELLCRESAGLQGRMDACGRSDSARAAGSRCDAQLTLQRRQWGNESVAAQNQQYSRGGSRLLHVSNALNDLILITVSLSLCPLWVRRRCQINTTPLKKQIGCIDVHCTY